MKFYCEYPLEASRLSVMPQGLDATFKLVELRDLIAFLHSLR